MSHEPSWRRVAEILAERLEHAARAAGSISPYGIGDRPGCTHSESEADPDNCPFCADRAAFQVFQDKVRKSGGAS
jgi:hypothetical protein